MRFLSCLRLPVLLLAVCLTGTAVPAAAEELSAAQREQIAKFLPRSHPRMVKRDTEEPLRVVVLGDSISNFYQPEADLCYDLDLAWHSVFLHLLADHFFLTGGVRQVGPVRRTSGAERVPDQDAPSAEAKPLNVTTHGMAVEVTTLARDGATVLQAFQSLTTEAFDNDPDLVLLMYGTNDAFAGVALHTYRQTLEAAAALCRSRGVDLIMAGPPLICGGDDRSTLALTRPYARIVREVAEKAGVLSVDAGAAQALTEAAPDGPATDVLARVRRHVRRQYDHTGTTDYFHPNTLGHRIIGEAVWKALHRSPDSATLTATGSFTLPAAADACGTLEITLRKAPSPEVQHAAISVLGFDRVWHPLEQLPAANAPKEWSAADAVASIRNGRTFRVPCNSKKPSAPNPGARVDLPFGEDDSVTASALVSDGNWIRLMEVSAPMLPVAVSFPTGRIEASGKEISLELAATNAEATPFDGTAELEWRGHVESFPIKLEPSKRTSFRVKLPLPETTAVPHFKSTVTLRLKRAAAAYAFVREIEFSRNLALEETVELANRSRMVADVPPAPSEPGEAPHATIKGDASGLYLVVDLPPASAATGASMHSAEIEVTIDARPPDQRGTIGFCDHILLQVPWRDGRFPVKKLRPALFGNGYDRDLNERFFLASLTTQRDSRRQVRLSIPRNYFYLHQWSLRADGQNTLGLNLIVSLVEFGEASPSGSFPFQKSYALVSPGMTRNDALALGVLDLHATPPAAGWSVRFY